MFGMVAERRQAAACYNAAASQSERLSQHSMEVVRITHPPWKVVFRPGPRRAVGPAFTLQMVLILQGIDEPAAGLERIITMHRRR